jgi:hypothetical protein
METHRTHNKRIFFFNLTPKRPKEDSQIYTQILDELALLRNEVGQIGVLRSSNEALGARVQELESGLRGVSGEFSLRVKDLEVAGEKALDFSENVLIQAKAGHEEV